VVWQGRRRLAQIPLKPSWSGLGIVTLALAVLVVGEMGAQLFLACSHFGLDPEPAIAA
jgi:hypothetical protein